MNTKLKIILVLIIVLQILSLVGFVIYQESLKDTGTKIILQTIPVDPRDLLRGEYVDLRYEISDITVENLRCYPICLGYNLEDKSSRSNSRMGFVESDEDNYIYLLLTKEPYLLAPVSISTDSSWYVYDINDSLDFGNNRPQGIESIVIRGQIEEVEEIVTDEKTILIRVDYGIEQYFLEEGKGRLVEDADDVKVEVNIATNGKAFITELIVDGKNLSNSVSN